MQTKQLIFSQSAQSPVRISGTGSALPSIEITNDYLSTFLDTSDEWIRNRVGIGTRYICNENESTVSLAEIAAREAMAKAGIDGSQLDIIIMASVTPDQQLPSAAAMLASRLGSSRAMAFDIKAACSGFLYAFATAESLLHSMNLTNALIIGAESLSRILDWNDRNTAVLFGDGAGACVLERSSVESPSCIQASCLGTDARGSQLIRRSGGAYPAAVAPATAIPDVDPYPYIQMEGSEVFKKGIQLMSDSIKRVLEDSGRSIDDVRFFIPHQSNMRMVSSVCRQVGFRKPDGIVTNLEHVGNTSAASIPIALHELAGRNVLEQGDLVLLTAVGSGMTYGSLLIEWCN